MTRRWVLSLQRNGRIIRQGNENPEVDIYTYVTKGTFDAYIFQLVENKQKFISQIMTSKSPARSAEDIDESVLNYAQIKALAAGNPKIKLKMDLDIEVSRLRTVFAAYQENKRDLQGKIAKTYPEKIQRLTERISGLEKDITLAQSNKTEDFSHITVDGKTYTDKKEAGTAFLESCRKLRADQQNKPVGSYRGFDLTASFDSFSKCYTVSFKNSLSHTIEIGSDIYGNLTRLENAINNLPKKLDEAKLNFEETKHLLSVAKEEVAKPFAQLDELREKETQLEELNKELSIDNNSEVTKDEQPLKDGKSSEIAI